MKISEEVNIRPLGNRILVKQSTVEEMTASGIVLPDTAEKEKKAQGKIIAVGNGEAIGKLGLKVGDTVVFGKFSGEEIESGLCAGGAVFRLLLCHRDRGRILLYGDMGLQWHLGGCFSTAVLPVALFSPTILGTCSYFVCVSDF